MHFSLYRSIITKPFTTCLGTFNTFLNGDFFLRSGLERCPIRATWYESRPDRFFTVFLINYNIFEPFAIRRVCFLEYPLTRESVDMIVVDKAY